MNMHLKIVILSLSLLATSAHPLHRNVRETAMADPKANQAHDKTQPIKNMGSSTYKNHIDGTGLYSQEDELHKTALAEEMQHKVNMESERLRIRLRQELSELRERLAPSPDHLSSTLASIRERLAPLTRQLHTSVRSNAQDLCGQLSLYLQALETAEAQQDAGPAPYQEAFYWIGQTLEHSTSKLGDITADFQSRSAQAIQHLKEMSGAGGGLWERVDLQLGQEVSSLRAEAQSRAAALNAELTALAETSRPLGGLAALSTARFCQNAALQSQALEARLERLLVELEAELQAAAAPPLYAAVSSSEDSVSSLQEDFSIKFSALIQDIMHSVQ